MHIREFRWPEDYNILLALWQDLGLHVPAIDGVAEISALVARNPGLFLVAVDEQLRIAGSVIGAYDGRRGYLYHVAVHPEARRQGIGTQLIREVERRLYALGVDKIRFTVGVNNVEAQAFYRSLGYSVDTHAVMMSKKRATRDG